MPNEERDKAGEKFATIGTAVIGGFILGVVVILLAFLCVKLVEVLPW